MGRERNRKADTSIANTRSHSNTQLANGSNKQAREAKEAREESKKQGTT